MIARSKSLQLNRVTSGPSAALHSLHTVWCLCSSPCRGAFGVRCIPPYVHSRSPNSWPWTSPLLSTMRERSSFLFLDGRLATAMRSTHPAKVALALRQTATALTYHNLNECNPKVNQGRTWRSKKIQRDRSRRTSTSWRAAADILSNHMLLRMLAI